MSKPPPNPTSPEWRNAFARHYADKASVGLFEAKRIAALVQPNLYMLPPADAVALLLQDPDVHATFQAIKGESDPRGTPRPSEGA